MNRHNIIPDEKSEAVARALQAAFGTTEIENIRQMTKGQTSALVLRVDGKGSAYLMRIIMRKNAMLSPARHFDCMHAAAEAGIAPRVWHTSMEDGISITDFVEEVPLPASEALV